MTERLFFYIKQDKEKEEHMDEKIDITGILFFAFFIAAGAITGTFLFPGCWWLSLPTGGVLGFLSAIIICFFLLLTIVCTFIFVLLLGLAFFSLKNLVEATKKFIKEPIRRIKTNLRII